MNKSHSKALLIVALIGVAMTACAQGTAEPEIRIEEVIVTQEVEVEVQVTAVPEVPEAETTIWFGAGSTLLDPYLVPIFTIGRARLAERGIDLQFVTLSTDEAVEAALDRGRIDVGLLSAVGFNRSVSQGLDFKFILGVEMHNTFVMTTASDVTDLAQLEGGTIASQSQTSLSVAVGEVMMSEQAGLESGEDYEMLFLPGSNNRAAAMEAGSIDAAVLFRNVAAQLATRSDGKFKIYGGLWDVLDPMMWEGLAVSDAFVAANPEVAAIFVEEILATYADFYAGDPAEMAALKEGIPEAEPLDTDELVGDYELYQTIELFPVDGGMDELFWTRITDFLVAIGQLEPDQVVAYEDAIDTTLLDAALK